MISSSIRCLRGFMLALLLALIFAGSWAFAGVKPLELVTAARGQVGVTLSYDAAYRVLEYPGGDVPKETGVCTDVVVRAFREQGIDLQKEMHEDMKREFSAYPRRWGLKKPDRNIDHRRVPNMMAYFKRQGWSVPVTKKVEDYLPGDLVTWDLREDLPHVGIISDRKTAEGVPLVIHNIGRGTQEEDILFSYTITGHYRPK
jgi:uncharacterized protein YijF (DUF1287 family)